MFPVARRALANDIAGMMRGNNRLLLKALAGFAIVTAGLIQPTLAQADVQECVAIGDDAARLACYDTLFVGTGPIDEEGDEPGIFETIAIPSERPIPARPTGREPAILGISCNDGAMLVAFRFAGNNVSNTGDIAPLTYQVDSGGTTVRTLRANADNTELSFATPADTETFLNSLAGGTSVRVRVTPVRQRSVNVEFRLLDFIDEIQALRANCG